MKNMVDPFGRTIDYLRVSVTDRCNFRCVYCMPEAGCDVVPKEGLLAVGEFAAIASVARSLGISKLRVTGGEPLVRKDIVEVVARMAKFGFEDMSLTTNGFLLAGLAKDLKAAGLNRVNISLDTLRPDRFRAVARRGDLGQVLNAIDAAFDAGLTPVKINAVAMRGVNDDEFVEFARWTQQVPVHVRFIELMPIRWNTDEVVTETVVSPSALLDSATLRPRFIPAAEIAARIEGALGPLTPTELATNGPARTFRLEGAPGTVGFISQISDDLCRNCNRLRVTADGFLRPCLMEDGEVDLRASLRPEIDEEGLLRCFETALSQKPERHYLAEGQRVLTRGMSAIGG